jgi:hypothetical protein
LSAFCEADDALHVARAMVGPMCRSVICTMRRLRAPDRGSRSDLDFAHARPAQGGERSRREGDEGAGDHRRRAGIAHEGMQARERQHGAPEL